MQILENILIFKKRVGNHVFWTLFFAVIFSSFAVLFTDYWLDKIADSNMKTIATTEDLLAIHKIKAYLPIAESAQRGYLLTQKKEYLKPFEANIVLLHQALNQLAVSKELQNNPEKTFVLDLLTSIDRKIAEMRLTIALADKRKIDEAMEVINLNQGLILMARIYLLEDKFLKFQYANLEKYRVLRSEKVNWARGLIISTILVLLIVIVTTFKTVLSEIVEKEKIREELAIGTQLNAQKLIDTTKQLQTLALDAQGDIERERNKLARELHDELGSILTATKMDVSWVIKKLRDIAPDIAEKLQRTNTYLDRGINFKRQIVEELHPSVVTTFGIWPAIKSLITDSAERNQWQLTLNMPEDIVRLNENIAMISYRVIQETLNNASKYSKASKIFVHIIKDEDWLKLEIEDNGEGFDMSTLTGKTHGIAGMQHRVQAIGGSFEIISTINQGTITRVLLPANINK